MTGTETLAETDRIHQHRVVQFLYMGYSMDESEMLASSPVDVHEIRNLVDNGCELKTAARICL
jgi:hypothetical protein